MRFPFEFVGEYRGRSAGGKFVREEGDEHQEIEYAEGMKFEIDLPDGDVELLQLRLNKFDQVAKFDAARLEKGQRVKLTGLLNTSESYGVTIRLLAAELVGAAKAGAGAAG